MKSLFALYHFIFLQQLARFNTYYCCLAWGRCVNWWEVVFLLNPFFFYENTAKLINLVVWDYFKISAYVLFSSLLIYQLTRLRNNFPTYLWILLLLGSVFYCASWILAQDFFTSLATVWIALVACVYLRNKKEENPTDSLLLLFALQGLLNAFVLYCLS